MGFPSQEYWSGLSFPPPGDLPDLEIKPSSPVLQVSSLPTEPLCVVPHLPRTSPNVIQPWQEPGTPVRLYSHEIHLLSPASMSSACLGTLHSGLLTPYLPGNLPAMVTAASQVPILPCILVISAFNFTIINTQKNRWNMCVSYEA